MLKTLYNSYNTAVATTYIIVIENNETSENMARRCIASCEKVGQSCEIWSAFDGTDDKELKVPVFLKDKTHISWPKLINSELSTRQVGCFMSHYSLWCRCLTLDQPIVILEHDAVMLKPYTEHRLYNSIVYLGSIEQAKGNPIYATPPHATHYNGLLRSLCRSHAYAIDPAVARTLVGYTITHGIYQSLDMYVRSDLFPMSQFDLYACDVPGKSTIGV